MALPPFCNRMALPLGDGLWWLHSEQTVKRPGLAFVTPDKPMRYLGQPLSGLFCPGRLGEAHQALLERLCALLIAGRGHELAVLPAVAPYSKCWVVSCRPTGRVRVLPWLTPTVYARPAKVLAQLAKSFAGEIRVKIVDGQDSAVSAKSLSKLLSLVPVAVRCWNLSPSQGIANDALPALLAAVEEGWGRGRAAADGG